MRSCHKTAPWYISTIITTFNNLSNQEQQQFITCKQDAQEGCWLSSQTLKITSMIIMHISQYPFFFFYDLNCFKCSSTIIHGNQIVTLIIRYTKIIAFYKCRFCRNKSRDLLGQSVFLYIFSATNIYLIHMYESAVDHITDILEYIVRAIMF